MHSVKILSAVAALGVSLVSAQTCTEDIIITEPTPVIDCEVVAANIEVDSGVAGDLSIEGPQQVRGDLIVRNATQLISLSSTSINAIGGTFELNGLELLSSLQMSSLRTLNDISLVKLPQLSGVTFGSSGVTRAGSVRISDTFISDLSGLNLATVDNFLIDNNPRLINFNSDLVNVTEMLAITSNGQNMVVDMSQLESAAEIQLSNIKSFTVPALTTVSKSIKFDRNPELESFAADNLTTIAESLTFINNRKLANISFPVLTEISQGDMTIQNNTLLLELDGFPELTKVFGGILLAGSFEKVELPSLDDVSGAVTVTSTTDISDFCGFFNDAAADGKIRGELSCTSNNAAANENGDGGESLSSDSSSDEEDAAGILSVNTALLSMAAIAGLVQLL